MLVKFVPFEVFKVGTDSSSEQPLNMLEKLEPLCVSSSGILRNIVHV
jgi:hypothetical protein